MSKRKNSPRRISFPEIRAIAETLRDKDVALPYMGNGISMLLGAQSPTFLSMVKLNTPYIIEEPRFGFVRKGSGRVLLNMIERDVEENTIIYMGKGGIMQPVSISDDLEICALMLDNERVSVSIEDTLKASFSNTATCFTVDATRKEAAIVNDMFNTIWALVHQKNCPDDTLNSLIQALTHYYMYLNQRADNTSSDMSPHSRTMFEQFINLLNTHCKEHHTLGFYADKMCVTVRYLGVLIKATSGVTAKEWIDRALITSAQVQLRHTDKQIARIADDLHFANASFFCKFFKRMTGMTPQKYRQS